MRPWLIHSLSPENTPITPERSNLHSAISTTKDLSSASSDQGNKRITPQCFTSPSVSLRCNSLHRKALTWPRR
jgi:hypothetical protein